MYFNTKEIGARIQKLRQEKHLTQEQLVEQPDTINQSDVIRYMARLSHRHMAEISRPLPVIRTDRQVPASCYKLLQKQSL